MISFSDKKHSNLEFNDGFPDVRLAPSQELYRGYRRIIKTKLYRQLLSYSDVAGEEKLREVLSRYLNETRGVPCGAENVFLTRGSQMGIYLAVSLLVKPWDNIIVGESNYYFANQVFKHFQAAIMEYIL